MFFLRYDSHLDRTLLCFQNNLKMGLSHRMLKSTRDPCNFGIHHQEKVISTGAYGIEETDREQEWTGTAYFVP